jgi:hypothetical protein
VKIALASIALLSMMLPLWALSFNSHGLGPEWKTIVVYGTGSVQGPIDEVNKANLYVGLEQLVPAEIVALKLIPLIYIIAAATITFSGWWFSLKKGVLLYFALLVSVPLGIQYWLYVFGHNISTEAPIALDPFTPYVIGGYQIATFTIVSYLHLGYFVLIGILVAWYIVGRKLVSYR